MMVRLEKHTFDQVVEQFLHIRTQKSRQQVLDYILAMPALYFVQCGRRSCPVPWITFESDVPIAMVFTEYDRATQAIKSFIGDEHITRIVGLPTNAASMYMAAVGAQGVSRVCFNHGPQRFDAMLEEVLLAMNSMKR